MREDLDNVLDEFLTQLLTEEERVEESLAQPQLEPLLHLAREIDALPLPEPNPRALRATQARVRDVAILKKEGARRGDLFPSWPTGQRVLLAFTRVLAVIVAAAVIGLGTVAASADSLPHSPLYPVKRTTERVQLFLTFSPSGKARLHLFFAERRLNETRRLTGCWESLGAVLMSMLEETDLAIRMMLTLPMAEAGPLLDRALELTTYQRICLSQLRGGVSTNQWCILDEAIAAYHCNEQILEGRIPDVHQPTIGPE